MTDERADKEKPREEFLCEHQWRQAYASAKAEAWACTKCGRGYGTVQRP